MNDTGKLNESLFNKSINREKDGKIIIRFRSKSKEKKMVY